MHFCLAHPVKLLVESMVETSQQQLLREAWLEGKEGGLSAREQAKAWALREVWRHEGKPEHGMKTFIAGKLKKFSVKKEGRVAPSDTAIAKFFAKVDADDDWFPGKANYENCGAPATMTGQQRATLARCAMGMKEKGEEPTYGTIVAKCPKAALNPKTGQPFSKFTVYGVFREDCYDDEPFLPWEHKSRYSKKALTQEMMTRRADFTIYVESLGHNGLWYYNHVAWTDLCSSILPLNEKKANEMRLARKGKKGWMSPGSELSNENLPGNPSILKQNSWNTMRIWWFPMLCRGKLHVELFDADFPGETPAGAKLLAEKVRSAVNVRFQAAASKPDVLFTDRGRGFYETNSGSITSEWKEAVAENGFSTFMGDNARKQPGSLQDILLHETAVSWLRKRLERTTPMKCWEESREAYGRRLKRCCEEVNKDCDVEGLCRGFPKRIRLLHDEDGGRLRY